MRSISRRKIRTHIEWNVEIQISSASGPTSVSIRSRISRAALFVKVIASTFHGATPFSPSKYAIRCVNTRVLPLPAPAINRSGPFVVCTAFCCCGFKPFNNLSVILIYACTYSPFTALTVFNAAFISS
ncbi:Uncharacterised protein [Streptococcus pneumoniae]|nr:Uncharacterised protein [Streptococcus pneumoniae]